MWYSADKLLTHNALFNFVISSRGDGKTYDFKKRAIRNFLKKGSQFIYLRRYKSDLKTIGTFFNDIIVNDEFPDHKLYVKGNKFYIDDNLAGYAFPLSTSITLKSSSFPLVTLIGFDEFLIKTGSSRYLFNEVELFLEFYSTVARQRDNVRVLFIGNAINLVNPYFLFWNIQPNLKQRINKYGQIAVEIYTHPEFIQKAKNTRFGSIIKNTSYGDYAIENQFTENTNDFIETKSKKAHYMCSIFYNNKTIGFWCDYKEGKFYASYKYDPSSSFQFILSTKDMRENKILITNAKKMKKIKNVIQAFQNSYLYYENQAIKNICFDIMKKLL